jgi:hypothetical protein
MFLANEPSMAHVARRQVADRRLAEAEVSPSHEMLGNRVSEGGREPHRPVRTS